MKRFPTLVFILIVSILLTGCRISHYSQTRPQEISGEDVAKLNIKGPIAVINTTTSKEQVVVCQMMGHKYIGTLSEFSDSAVGTVKIALGGQNVKFDDTSAKKLEISLPQVFCEIGMVKLRATVVLKAKTADGLEKEYKGWYNYMHGFATTAAFERAISSCVSQMLNDPEIIVYLES